MIAVQHNLLQFLKKAHQFQIPIFQRTYSWTEGECQQLWDDILRSGSDPTITSHFTGSIVYIQKGAAGVASPFLVIDGQQRLTTVSLILEALARQLENGAEPVTDFTARKIRGQYLLNPLYDGEDRYKLVLTQTDKDTLKAFLDHAPLPSDQSLRMKSNFRFYKRRIDRLGGDLAPLCHGLSKLMIVDVALTQGQDNPQLIFESMNSTGRELSQADLIRNFILMGLDTGHQEQLYNYHWRPMELAFGQEAYGKHFDGFTRHYLTFRMGEIPKIRRIYEAFKRHALNPDIADFGMDGLVRDVHRFADHYCAMAFQSTDQTPHKPEQKALGQAFAELRELKVDVAYPLLLELYDDYKTSRLTQIDFLTILRWIESYVFRRAVCAIPTNSLNKTFAGFAGNVDKDRYLESFQAHMLLLPSHRRFPRDEEFARELQHRDLYNFRNRSYFFRRMENHKRKEHVSVEEYTIEHILPQNPNLTTQWRDALGHDWRSVQEKWLHTLGNLTLTGYNPEYSDKEFQKKRDMSGGFRDSPLQLNTCLRQLNAWNESEIQSRANRLARMALEVWPAPHLEQAVLEQYRPKKGGKDTGYTIEDHKQLAVGQPVRGLFEVFRTEVKALNPCVTEEFLKLYVAYKAETNFVDVVPQAKRLRLSLNLDFHDLRDPKRMARDVTNLGRWGNGNAEVHLGSEDQIPYVMGLVRQAYDSQMGDDATDD